MTDLTTRHGELRPLMFSIAYRMLGSVAEAEDIVQEAFLRMHRDQVEARTPDAYAATVTTRLAIDHLRSARVRREKYVGTWLPEPLVGTYVDPADSVEANETLSMAFLVVMESLAPVERAVFLLREVFGYDYDEIARIVDKSEQNCRQLFSRARNHLKDRKPRFDVSKERQEELGREFFTACASGDLSALERLLATNVEFCGDNAGRPPAVRRAVEGRVQVARFMIGLMRQGAQLQVQLEPVTVNGQPGAKVFGPDGKLLSVLALHIADGEITSVSNVMAPEKLGHLGPIGDIMALMRGED